MDAHYRLNFIALQIVVVVFFSLIFFSACHDDDKCNEIQCLEPQDVWGYFYDLTQTPRQSGEMEKVRALLVDFGHSLNLETIVDNAGNVMIRKPAAPGMEDRKGVILQAHMDMVAQKDPDVIHDFNTDPIETEIVGTVVKAKGTTLGADDGIGVALIMAVLASKKLKTGPIEGLFTVDEETTMSGANGLEPDLLQGEILINLDWETEGSFCIGSAGGQHVNAYMIYANENVSTGMEGYRLELTGLLGGHSGIEIDKNRGNAAIIMSRFVQESAEKFDVRLSELESGSAANAIPNEANAIMAVAKEQSDAFVEYVKTFESEIKNELGDSDPGVQLTVQSVEVPGSVINAVSQKNIIDAIVAEPNGVLKMSEDVPGLVQTSSNLGILKIADNQFSATNMPRSSVDEELDEVSIQLQQIYFDLGAQCEFSDRFPTWEPNIDSPLLQSMTQIYESLFSKSPDVEIIHAGLECGTILSKYPNLDAISIGPTLRYVHTTDEEVEIETVEKVKKLLIGTLETIP